MEYIKLGKNSKIPKSKNGKWDVVDQITDKNADYGLLTGKNNLLVLDIDRHFPNNWTNKQKSNYIKAQTKLLKEKFNIDLNNIKVPYQKTKTGGYHLFYKLDNGYKFSKSKAFSQFGIDIITGNNYVKLYDKNLKFNNIKPAIEQVPFIDKYLTLTKQKGLTNSIELLNEVNANVKNFQKKAFKEFRYLLKKNGIKLKTSEAVQLFKTTAEKYGELSSQYALKMFNTSTMLNYDKKSTYIANAEKHYTLDDYENKLDYSINKSYKDTYYNACQKNNVKYARVPSGAKTCAFCTMLASRGFVYKTGDTAGEMGQFHKLCDCQIVASVEKSPSIKNYNPYEFYWQYKNNIRITKGGNYDFKVKSIKDEWVNKNKNKGGKIANKPFGSTKTEDKKTAKWLTSNFGGKLKYVDVGNSKTPDYFWKSKQWELKTSGNKNSLRDKLKKAKLQTKDGNVIVDIKNTRSTDIQMQHYLIKQIIKHDFNTMIIKKGDSLIEILRRTA